MKRKSWIQISVVLAFFSFFGFSLWNRNGATPTARPNSGNEQAVSTSDPNDKLSDSGNHEQISQSGELRWQSLSPGERKLASSYSKNRRDGHEAEWVLYKIYPKLYQEMLIEKKALKSAEDGIIQREYLTSNDFRELLKEILISDDSFVKSNTGEYARLHAMRSLRLAMDLDDQTQREGLGDIMVETLSMFPSTAEPDVLNSMKADRITLWMLLKKHFPERAQRLLVAGSFHPEARKLIQSYEKNPDRYNYLLEI